MPLCGLGGFSAASTTTRVLHSKMKWRCAGKVSRHRIRSGLQQTIDGGRTACTHRAVQRRRSVFVSGVNVGSCIQQTAKSLHLLRSIEAGAHNIPVRGVMQRARAAVIVSRIGIGAGRDQHSSDHCPMTGGGQVQRSIFCVDPMKDLRLTEPGLIHQFNSQPRIFFEQFPGFPAVIVKNCPQQVFQIRFARRGFRALGASGRFHCSYLEVPIHGMIRWRNRTVNRAGCITGLSPVGDRK